MGTDPVRQLHLPARDDVQAVKGRILGRDFFVEVIGGAAFIGCGIHYGCGSFGLLSMRGIVMLIYFGILLVVALIDWDTRLFMIRFHIFILILAIANIWLVPEHGLIDRLIGALIISVPMLLLALVLPGAFGGGDIKFCGILGLVYGPSGMALVFLTAAVTAMPVIFLLRRLYRTGQPLAIPFLPFLACGCCTATLAQLFLR